MIKTGTIKQVCLNTTDRVIFLIGRSGSGKSTVASMLVERNNFSEIVSYTTRPKRYVGEQGHIFVDTPTCLEKVIDGRTSNGWDFTANTLKPNIIAYTYFDGNHYWATREQIKGNTIYVIDQAGVDYFKQHFPDIPTISFYLDLPPMTCYHRLLLRDGEDKASQRFKHDEEAFRCIKADYTITPFDNNERTCELIEEILKEKEFI